MRKQRIRLSEATLHRIIRQCVNEAINKSPYRKKINETKDYFDDESFNKWEETTHIPKDVMDIVRHVAEKVGCEIDEEETITLYNRGGYPYAYGKGFTLTHCTSSNADGPSTDYSGAIYKWLKGLGFYVENSHGDNGMDSATNYRDTYWTNEFVYKPSVVDADEFMVWGDDDYIE